MIAPCNCGHEHADPVRDVASIDVARQALTIAIGNLNKGILMLKVLQREHPHWDAFNEACDQAAWYVGSFVGRENLLLEMSGWSLDAESPEAREMRADSADSTGNPPAKRDKDPS